MNTKLLTSLLVIGVVGTVATGSTLALFSDTETSSDNVFTAGAIDLQLGQSNGGTAENDVFYENGGTQAFFSEGDVKPGDINETTVAFNVTSNPYYGCVVLENISNDENTVNEPEASSPNELNDISTSPITGDGELAETSSLFIWAELDGNNVYDDGETPVITRNSTYEGGNGLPTSPVAWTLADANENIYPGNSGGDPLQPDTTYYLGVEYRLPMDVGNEAQTDSYEVDARFEVVQFRNNEDFTCDSLLVDEEDTQDTTA